MNTSLTQQAHNYREGRRLRAWELHQQGWSQARIAQALGVTQGAVSQWFKRVQLQGLDALRHHPPPGAPSRLSSAQHEHLKALLAQGPLAFGFRGEVWTTARVARLIADQFGVRYHPAHVSRLLRRLGWSVQTPILRASQRDEAAVQEWVEQRWPALKKKPTANSARSSG